MNSAIPAQGVDHRTVDNDRHTRPGGRRLRDSGRARLERFSFKTPGNDEALPGCTAIAQIPVYLCVPISVRPPSGDHRTVASAASEETLSLIHI